MTTKLQDEEATTPLIGKWGPMKAQTLDEEARATTQKRKRKRTPKQPLSQAQREYNLSEHHIAHLRAMSRKRAEADGKRVTPHIGSVHGWGGSKRKELVRIRAEAARKAEIVMKHLEDEGVIEATLDAVVGQDGTVNDAAAANAALRFSVEIMLGGDTYPLNAKQQAASVVLQYTKSKPEQKSTVKVDAAHDFLMSVLASEAENPTE